MSTCPQCGGKLSGPDALCPDCLQRVTLKESGIAEQTASADSLRDLLPESAQPRPSRTTIVPGPAKVAHGEQWGDYELLEPLGTGAMGTVFKARHTRLNRLVALKRIRQGTRASDEERKRFLREAEAVARLQHPHIVTLYDTGEVERDPYLAMEYVPGQTLAEAIGKNPLPPRQAAACVKKISEAVQYAHEHGVLHRDLKPSNVALDSRLEPRVMDFGLARLEEQDSEMTVSGMAIGSPSYMAPEQAAGKVHEVGAASDIYSIGAILYEALTGRPPFQADSAVETMRQVVESEPVSPRLLNAIVPRDLETVCLKCLEKDPPRRYATARALAQDLGRFLRNEPIVARPIGPPARLARWCRRKPALALSLSVGASLLLVIAIGSPIAAFRINRERKLAEVSRKQEAALRLRAEAAEMATHQQLYTALLEQARATVQSQELGQRVRALEAVRRASAISNSAALRGAAIAALALPDLRFEREWPLRADTTLVVLDPAFQRIALCRGASPVEIRSVADQRLLATLPASTNRPCYGGLWSPDSRFFALSRDHDSMGQVKDTEVWELEGQKCVLVLRGAPWGAMSFHPRLPRIIVACAPDTAVTWDLETGRELTRHELDGKLIALKFAPDGERFASLCNSGKVWTVVIHQAADGSESARHIFTNLVRDLTWHPGGRRLAVPDRGGALHLMEAETGETSVIGHHKAEAVVAEFSPDGRYLFTGGWDRELICWDLEAARLAFTIGLDSYRLQIRNDGRACAVLRWPEVRLQLHAFDSPTLHREFREDLGARRKHAAFSPDGRWLAASGGEHVVVWDLAHDGPGVAADQAWATEVSFAPNGELFASRLGGCFRWRVKPGTNGAAPPRLEQPGLANPPDFGSLCPLSNGVVVITKRGARLATYDQLASDDSQWLPTSYGYSKTSSEERWVGIYGTYSREFEVLGLPGFKRLARLANQANILGAEFSPVGDEVAVFSRRGIEFWSTTSWQPTRQLTNFTDIHYSPDARTAWLSTEFRTGGLYNARTAEPILPLPLGTLPLAVSPDGRHLAVSVNSRRVQLWDLLEVRSRLRELALDWTELP